MGQLITIVVLEILCLICQSNQSIFSSILRNNLNRYLKNPLFTKSFVRHSAWPGESDEYGGVSPLVQPQNTQINDFIKSQNKFTDHVLDAYGNYNFNLLHLNNDYVNMISGPKGQQQQSPSAISPPVTGESVKQTNYSPNFPQGGSSDEKKSRANSKSLLVTTSINAYSDAKKMQSFGRSLNTTSSKVSAQRRISTAPLIDHWQINQHNTYINDNIARSPNSASSRPSTAEQRTENKNFETHLGRGNKYNQEKALNLKLEYGFKPLPPKPDLYGNFKQDFTVSNSIQMNDPDEGDQASDSGRDDTNLYASPTNINRTMKAIISDVRLEDVHKSNQLEEFSSTDYKKYISYPMETESSDIHKLAFTGVESFKPDHSYLESNYQQNYRFVDTIANYPNIKHFKTQGIDCARGLGYCEYDSSYPTDYVNSIISNCTSIIDDMYIEMPDNLADFSGYKSFIQVGHTSHTQSNVSLCDSERKYIRPSAIQDVNGDYYLILQSSFYFQQVPVEICRKPGSTCNFVGRCGTQVKCRQKYRTHMLISLDSEHSGRDSSGTVNCPKMRMYRLPSACVCELSQG